MAADSGSRTGRLRRLSQLRTYTASHLIPSSSSASSPPSTTAAAAAAVDTLATSPGSSNHTATTTTASTGTTANNIINNKKRNRNSLGRVVGLSSPFHFSTSASAPESAPEPRSPSSSQPHPHGNDINTSNHTSNDSDPRSSGSLSTNSAELPTRSQSSSASSQAPALAAAAAAAAATDSAMPAAAPRADDNTGRHGHAAASDEAPAAASDADSASASASRSRMASRTIRFFSYQDSNSSSRPSLHFPPMSRTIPSDDSVIRIGRYSERDGVPVANPTEPSDAPMGFKSKVVSRKHCELSWSNNQWHIRDVGSSSGTFLNRIRLSPPNVPSRHYPIRDGDVIQLGIDFRGGEEMIFRCVRIRIECNRTWQQMPNEFNKNTENLINNLGKGKAAADFEGCRECSICLGSVLRPYQCLFMAACAHVWHYKCISRLLHSRDYPMFQCPNCRVWTDLNAEIDDSADLEEEGHTELEPKPAIEAANGTSTATDHISEAGEQRPSSNPDQTAGSDAAAAANELAASVENMGLEDRSTPLQDGENPDSGENTSNAEIGTSDDSGSASAPGRSANIPIPTSSSSALRVRTSNAASPVPATFEDNPMTPRNDSGALALDGRTGRL